MKWLYTIITLAVAISVLNIGISCTNAPEKKVAKSLSASEAHLGEHMGQMQYYVVKLGLALQHKNQPLANFYAGEVNETYEEMRSLNIVDDSIPISRLLNQLLSPVLQNVTSVISQNDTAQFLSQYQALIETCNSCHKETGRPFIVVQAPHEEYNGQDFSSNKK